jgi:hypothetical protein
MKSWILLTGIIFWYLSGVFSFIYWWRKEYDITLKELILVLIIGLEGPFAFIVGWAIHGAPYSKIIIHRKED